MVDHNTPTDPGRVTLPFRDPIAKQQLDALKSNCEEFGINLFDMASPNQGIVHIIGPEQGWTQPGKVIVCGDSHTSTHGAFGALAFGIGTSEVEHVLATQTVRQSESPTMEIRVNGALPFGVTAKDLILGIIGQIGIAGGQGHVVEYTGEAVRSLSMDGRMTVCNMSIEGARESWDDRSRRDDLRVPAGPSQRSAKGRLRGRRRSLVEAEDGRWSRVR